MSGTKQNNGGPAFPFDPEVVGIGSRGASRPASVNEDATEAAAKCHPMSDRLRKFRAGDMLAYNGAIWVRQAADELDRLWSIVSRLPLTADGVTISPKDSIYRVKDDRSATARPGSTFMESRRLGLIWVGGDIDGICSEDWYSTRAAAEAAKGGKSDE